MCDTMPFAARCLTTDHL